MSSNEIGRGQRGEHARQPEQPQAARRGCDRLTLSAMCVIVGCSAAAAMRAVGDRPDRIEDVTDHVAVVGHERQLDQVADHDEPNARREVA